MTPSARAGAPRPWRGTVIPTLAFGCYLLGAAAAGVMLVAGWRVYGLLAGWTVAAGSAAVTAMALVAAVGAVQSGQRVTRLRLPAAVMAILQAGFGLTALASPLLFDAGTYLRLHLWPRIGRVGVGDWTLDLIAAFTLFALPVALFAAQPPVLGRLIFTGHGGLGLGLGFAFGLTLAGVGLGTGLGGGLLLPALGIRGAFLMGLALAGLAAAGTVLLRQRGLEGPGAIGAAIEGRGMAGGEAAGGGAVEGDGLGVVTEPGTASVGQAGLLGAAMMLFSFSAWGYLLTWQRTLSFMVGASAPARATTAAVFVLSMAAGAFLMAGLADRLARPLAALTWLLGGSALVAYGSMWLVPAVGVLYLKATPLLSRPLLWGAPMVLAAVSLVLPAGILLGLALPLLPLAARSRGRLMSGTVMYLALGVILAEILVPRFIVPAPAFGLRNTLSLAAAVALLSAIFFAGFAPARNPALRTTISLALLGLMVLVGAYRISWDPRIVDAGLYRYGLRSMNRFVTADEYLKARRGVEMLFYYEGPEATVAVERTLSSAGGATLESLKLTVDGKVEATTGQDLRTQILQGHIPLLVHGPAESVLLIDFLNGVTAGSMLRHPIKSLHVIEREPYVFEAEAIFRGTNQNPLQDGRLARIVDEPRARLTVDPQTYDVIVVAAMNPWLPHSASLATVEGLDALKRRLRPGGLLAQRVPLSVAPGEATRQILRTFAAAFGSVLVFQTSPDDLLLLGSDEPLAIDIAWVRNVITSSTGVANDLGRAIVLGPNEIVQAFRCDRQGLLRSIGDGPRDRDDAAAVEFAAVRELTVHRNEALLAAIDGHRTSPVTPLRNYGTSPAEKAAFLYNLAKSFLGIAGDPERARLIAAELPGLGRTAAARWVSGESLLQMKDVDGALGEWRAVLDLDPDNIDALFSLGTYYLDDRDYWKAEPHLARAARLQPGTAVLRYHHGRNLFYLGRHREAITELEEAVRLDRSEGAYPLEPYMVGVSLLRLGSVDEAIKALKGYLEWAYRQDSLTRVEVDAHLKLAEAYDRREKRFEAHQEREKGNALLRRIQEYAARQAAASGQGTAGSTGPAPASDAPPADRP